MSIDNSAFRAVADCIYAQYANQYQIQIRQITWNGDDKYLVQYDCIDKTHRIGRFGLFMFVTEKDEAFLINGIIIKQERISG